MTAKFLEYPNGYPTYDDDELQLRNTDNSLKVSNLRVTNFDEDQHNEQLINISEPLALTAKSLTKVEHTKFSSQQLIFDSNFELFIQTGEIQTKKLETYREQIETQLTVNLKDFVLQTPIDDKISGIGEKRTRLG